MINSIYIGNSVANPVYNTDFFIFGFQFKIFDTGFQYRNNAFCTDR